MVDMPDEVGRGASVEDDIVESRRVGSLIVEMRIKLE